MYRYAPQAQGLAGLGRYGDSMLVHMQPQEVAGLEAIARSRGGSLTINPHTGLVEAWGIGDIFGSKGIVGKGMSAIGLGDAYSGLSKGVSGALQGVTKAVAPYLPYILPFVPIPGLMGMSPLLTRALISAAVGGLGEDGKNFNVKKGLTAGAMTYGLGSLTGAGEAGASGADASSAGMSEGVGYGDVPSTGAAGSDFSGVAGQPSLPPTPTPTVSSGISAPSGPVPAGQPAPVTNLDMAPGSVPAASPGADAAGYGNLASAAGETAINALTPTSAMDALKMASTGAMAYGSIGSMQEAKRQREEAERVLREQEKHTKEQIAFAKSVLAKYPLNYSRPTASDVTAAGGGLLSDLMSTLSMSQLRGVLDKDQAFQQLPYDQRVKAMMDSINAMKTDNNGYVSDGLKKVLKTPSLQRELAGFTPEDSVTNFRRSTADDVTGILAGQNKMAGGRYLQGAGDGTSDSIPARINGRQEARLADGEFVVDARTVSELGNGSSNAGAKKLYEMMNRVHAARRTAKRGKPSNADKYLPA